MTLRINRRHFSTAAIAAPTAMAISATHAQTDGTPAASEIDTVGLTSTFEEWTIAAGEPTPVGDSENMFSFVSPIDGETPVTVTFVNDIASFMEYNYGEAGPGQEDAYAIVAASIPMESMPGERFLLPAQNPESSVFTAQVYAMPSAPNSVILSVMALGAMEAEEASVVSISISLPNVDGSDHGATGAPGGIGLTRDEWIAIYGEPADGGAEVDFYPGVGPDGMNVATSRIVEQDIIRGIHVYSSPEAPIAATRESAVAFVGGSVPEDSVVGQYITMPATESGPIALDAVLWNSPTLQEQLAYKGTILSVMYLTADDTGVGVQRVDVAMNSENL